MSNVKVHGEYARPWHQSFHCPNLSDKISSIEIVSLTKTKLGSLILPFFSLDGMLLNGQRAPSLAEVEHKLVLILFTDHYCKGGFTYDIKVTDLCTVNLSILLA